MNRRTDQFYTHEILTGRNAVGDGEGHLSFVGYQSVDAPLATRVQTIVVDFEPFESSNRRLQSVWNLSPVMCVRASMNDKNSCLNIQVNDNGAFVGRVDWVCSISWGKT